MLITSHRYEIVNINTKVKPEWFFSKNPLGLVPVLEKDDKIVYESAICNEYLDEAYSDHGPRLFPSDPYAKARMQMLMESCTKVGKLELEMINRQAKASQKALSFQFLCTLCINNFMYNPFSIL